MRVAILGSGGIACLFSARLAPLVPVTLVASWAEGLEAISRDGICIESSGTCSNVRVAVASAPHSVERCDLVLVARKAWQTREAAAWAASILSPEGVALTFQNGLGNLETLESVLGSKRAALGVTNQGATLLGPGRVRHAGGGETWLGFSSETQTRVEEAASLLTAAGFETRTSPDVNSLLWGKLTVSCSLNPLTALLGVRNGCLLHSPEARSILAQAARECAAVAAAQEIRLPFADPVAYAEYVAEVTRNNYSSMLQDLRRGAPTEIEAINGAVARLGARLGVSTRVNALLADLVRARVSLAQHVLNPDRGEQV